MKTILLIDDDPTMVLLLETLLDIEGYHTASWEGNENIYNKIKQTNPDLVLLDVNLRGENGLEALGKIRADETLNKVRMVLTSGIDYKAQALEAGADHFIQKPYMPADLINLIKKQIQEAG